MLRHYLYVKTNSIRVSDFPKGVGKLTRHQTLSIIIIIGLIASTIFYIGQVATAPAPCDDVQMRHLFLSHANVAFVTGLVYTTLATREQKD